MFSLELYRILLKATLTWRDNRLTFYNLKHNMSSNVVGTDVAELLWTPSLKFPNAVGDVYINYSKNSYLVVERQGQGTTIGVEETEEGIKYAGSENSIQLVQELQFKHNCQFDLLYYPFDIQTCTLQVYNPRRWSP